MDAGSLLLEVTVIARSRAGSRIPIVGVAGSQGSGKTTLVKALVASDPSIAAFSLDDVYLPRSYRQLIAKDVHPLFVTRGPPGTHNLMQLGETLDALQETTPTSATQLPAFDKVADNPLPASRRPVFRGRPSLIVLEGWCVGATAQTDAQLATPVNPLEEKEDANGVWRREINANLAGGYQDIFSRLDATLYLRPPSFEIVHAWRCQQEEGLLDRPLTDDDRARIARFIQHYERLTRHMMASDVRADVTVQLDEARQMVEVKRRPG